MDRRARQRGAWLVVAACLLLGGLPATALAYVTTDLINFDLTETTSSYGGGTQFHISSGTDGWVSYRWLDVPSKDTVISGNFCSDLSLIGKSSIPSGNTAYHQLFNGFQGECFIVRGRTAAGEGSMTNYDGRIQR
ncbi:MAG: hypothetical protein QOF12_1821 [Solirubrobacteraceae bacterium]|jgi:hypothetical protein|nr:hypothetical protein [Solirubrobacteraceae bacterium]